MGNLVSISDSSTLIGAHQPATIRAPEIEAGVGCDFDSYLLVPDNALDDRIAAAKARLGQDVVILGHHYQRDEVVKFADFRGDSLKLSFQASPISVVTPSSSPSRLRRPKAAILSSAAYTLWPRAPTFFAVSTRWLFFLT